MIELIFVIVIIGILAAVAIPKLAATRSDAEGAKIANNLATCINEAGGAYLKDGNFSKVTSDAAADFTDTNINTVACLSVTTCFDLNGTASLGTMSVADSSDNSKTCDEAQNLASKNSMSGTTHQF
jgi:general secretion pathway protein G